MLEHEKLKYQSEARYDGMEIKDWERYIISKRKEQSSFGVVGFALAILIALAFILGMLSGIQYILGGLF